MVATKVVTGEVRLSYVHVFKPSAIGEGDEPKYSVSLIIPKSDKETLKKIDVAVKAAIEAGKGKWGGKIPKGLKLPLRDGDEDRPDDEAYENSMFINASARTRPNVVKRYMSPITDEEELYSGCYVHVSVNFYAYDAKGNRGIAAGLNNIMKTRNGEALGGRVSAEVDFADLELEDDDDSYLD